MRYCMKIHFKKMDQSSAYTWSTPLCFDESSADMLLLPNTLPAAADGRGFESKNAHEKCTK